MAFEKLASWLSDMFAKGVASITSVLSDALSMAQTVLPNLDTPTFIDSFRASVREEQFADMLRADNISQVAKDTEFIESADIFPRNYKVRFLVEYQDPDTGEFDETYRTMYTDTRLPNEDLANLYAAQWISGSPNMPPEGGFMSVDLVEHSFNSPYGPL